MCSDISKPTWGIVLAAGFGKRLRPLTDHMPKPLIPVGGIIPLDHAINNLMDVGVTNIVVNGHYKAEMINDYLEINYSNKNEVKVHFIYEPGILETGGGVMNIMQRFNIERAIVSNSDVLLINKKQAALKPLIDNKNKGQLLLMVQHYTESLQGATQGDFILMEDDRFIFDKDRRGPYTFVGSYIVSRELFLDRKEVSCFSMLEYFIKNDERSYKDNPYFVNKYKGLFLDINTPALLDSAQKIINEM